MQELFIGRQPIFDRDLHAIAYELLFRRGEVASAGVVDGDQATSQVLLNAFVELGLDQVAGDAPVFINLTRSFLLHDESLPFPPGRVVFEVLEGIEPDREVVEGVRRLAARGHAIALDDFIYRDELQPLVELAQIVKIDIRQLDGDGLRDHVSRLRQWPVKLLAEKVETHEEFALCRELGFDFFQGYFLSRPRVLKGQSLPVNRLATLRLLARLQDPEVNPDEVQRLVSEDVALSYRLLRLVNSAAMGLPRKVESIKQAVVYLGNRTIRNWACLLVAAGVVEKPAELLTLALVRGRMCRRLAELGGIEESDTDFTVGLFSALDALLDVPMETLLEQLPLSAEVNDALLRLEGRLGRQLACALAYERWDWEELGRFSFPLERIHDAYLDAVKWADELTAELVGGG